MRSAARFRRPSSASAAAKQTERGWRLVKADDGNVDAVIALAMACERA
jgi:hypothetical protein